MAKRIDISSINTTMIATAGEQEASAGSSKVWDADFPLMDTPLNRKVLVYIPKDFEERKAELLIHDTRKGKRFGQYRCVNGLSVGFESFGYTGECPFCQATEAAWELYNYKLEQKAKELGISRDNDPDELLKGTKENLLKEMAVKNADKYICFPVVLIPSDEAGNLIPNSTEPVKAVYVLWRKSRYDEKFSSDTLESRTSPAGTFERWSFTYDTKGQQPTAMLSAKALKVKIIENADQLATLETFREACEQVVQPFTQLKAVDNIKALNFYTYDDCVAEADAIIKPTRLMLSAAQGGATATDAPALGTAPAVPQLNAADAIANFGQAGATAQPMGTVQPLAGANFGNIGTVAPDAATAPAPVAPETPSVAFGAVPNVSL